MTADDDFEVAGPEVADLRHVAGEARLQGDAAWIGLEIDKQLLRLRVDLDAGEVLDPAEGVVELPGRLGYVVAERQKVSLQGVVEVPQVFGRLLVELGDGLLGGAPGWLRCVLGTRRRGRRAGRCNQVESEVRPVVVAVADQLDAAVDLGDGVLVVAGEVTGDADQPRA